MVEHGMGLTLVPEIAVDAECRNRNLKVTPFGDPPPLRHIMLFHASRSANADELAIVASIIRDAAGALLGRV